jgi:hypothetical protein
MDKKHRQREEERAEFHKRILDRLKCNENVDIGQYKDLYFQIFREAYESGFCVPLSYRLIYKGDGVLTEWIHGKPLASGDSIWHYSLQQGWCHSDMCGNEQRYKQIQIVMTWWDEWTCAWRNLRDQHYPEGYKTRRYRTIDKRS